MTSMTDLARQDGDAPSRGVRANPLTPWLFLFAPLGLLLVFTLVPVLSMIWYSFTNWDGLDPDVSFVGVKNYQTLLTRPALFQVFFVSLYYVAASFLQMALALYFATVLSFRTRLRNLFKVWDDQLGKRKYAGGDEISVAGRMAAIVDSSTTGSTQLQALQDAARARNVELSIHRIASAEEIPAAIDAAKASGAGALNVMGSAILFGNRQIIMQRVAALRLPAIYQWADEAEEGGFVAYGPRLVQVFRELVTPQLVKLLRGTKPADLPVEQPTKFELVINLKTANELGIAVPATLVARADKVIE